MTMELSELKEHIRVINTNPEEVSIETVQSVIGDLIGAVAGANDLAEIALSRMSEHEQHQPIGKGLKRLRDYARTLDMADGFTKKLPDEKGYWWHLLSEGCSPVPVWILYSDETDSYYAAAEQHGWDRYKELESMGGFWKKAKVPENLVVDI